LSGKEYSSSKSDKSRKGKADEKKGSKTDPKKREKGNLHKPKTARQYRMELEREILQDESMDLLTEHEGNEVHHCATFVSHYISGKRLFMKGTTEKDKLPDGFMPIQQAYETDGVQLYRYTEENDLLFHPEIWEIFSLGDYIRDSSKMQEKAEDSIPYSDQDNSKRILEENRHEQESCVRKAKDIQDSKNTGYATEDQTKEISGSLFYCTANK
jgi:hypothetical protein